MDNLFMDNLGDAIREREVFVRKREYMTKKVIKEVKKMSPRESSLGGNTNPCRITLPKNGKKWTNKI